MDKLKAKDVFIPGGLPEITYVSRDHLNIESQVSEWAEGAHTSLLSLSGPTKSGKTVLLKRIFQDAIWLSGGAIESAEEFWESICEELEIFTDYSLTASRSGRKSSGVEVGLSGGIANLNASHSDIAGDQRSVERGRTRSSKVAARSALLEKKPVVIIDDFHYIPSEEQTKIVRGLKDLVFQGAPIILVAVPHRAYDAVRVEKEMTGRVQGVDLEQWSKDDLERIAILGFPELQLEVSEDVMKRLADESFGSPHLMQTHCLALANMDKDPISELCKSDWDDFFRERSSAASKNALELLKKGPPRSNRNVRKLKSGEETDIYGAVLAAISNTGPRTELSYEQLRTSLVYILVESPQRHEVTNILDQMTKIARENIDGEPVLEYDKEYATLYIADPFFAYYLRWAPEALRT